MASHQLPEQGCNGHIYIYVYVWYISIYKYTETVMLHLEIMIVSSEMGVSRAGPPMLPEQGCDKYIEGYK